MYQTTIYIATFMAPLVGTAMAESVGIAPALVLSTRDPAGRRRADGALGVGSRRGGTGRRRNK